ncbi:rCG59019, partial [Rattus norvegicus]
MSSGQDKINFVVYFVFRQLPSVSMDCSDVKVYRTSWTKSASSCPCTIYLFETYSLSRHSRQRPNIFFISL